ncbi:heme-binding protein [soil metagenome]
MTPFASVLLAATLLNFQPHDEAAQVLITRNHAKLHQAGAQQVLQGATAKAIEMKLTVNISVVDEGGHLLAFIRMDGARPASVYTSLTKATAAATYRQATGPNMTSAGQPDILLGLSLQNAAAASGGKMTSLKGGIPIVVDGQVIGAVGVGGGTGEQDAEVAKAGVATLQAALGKSQQNVKTESAK